MQTEIAYAWLLAPLYAQAVVLILFAQCHLRNALITSSKKRDRSLPFALHSEISVSSLKLFDSNTYLFGEHGFKKHIQWTWDIHVFSYRWSLLTSCPLLSVWHWILHNDDDALSFILYTCILIYVSSSETFPKRSQLICLLPIVFLDTFRYDLISLIFDYMQKWLFRCCTDPFIQKCRSGLLKTSFDGCHNSTAPLDCSHLPTPSQ